MLDGNAWFRYTRKPLVWQARWAAPTGAIAICRARTGAYWDHLRWNCIAVCASRRQAPHTLEVYRFRAWPRQEISLQPVKLRRSFGRRSSGYGWGDTAVTQRIMVPAVSGKVKSIESGSFTVDETVQLSRMLLERISKLRWCRDGRWASLQGKHLKSTDHRTRVIDTSPNR